MLPTCYSCCKTIKTKENIHSLNINWDSFNLKHQLGLFQDGYVENSIMYRSLLKICSLANCYWSAGTTHCKNQGIYKGFSHVVLYQTWDHHEGSIREVLELFSKRCVWFHNSTQLSLFSYRIILLILVRWCSISLTKVWNCKELIFII